MKSSQDLKNLLLSIDHKSYPAYKSAQGTTLQVMMKYTGEENVVLSVFNGVVCSAFVPVLLPLCYHLGLR